jgi:hypothetical protein
MSETSVAAVSTFPPPMDLTALRTAALTSKKRKRSDDNRQLSKAASARKQSQQLQGDGDSDKEEGEIEEGEIDEESSPSTPPASRPLPASTLPVAGPSSSSAQPPRQPYPAHYNGRYAGPHIPNRRTNSPHNFVFAESGVLTREIYSQRILPITKIVARSLPNSCPMEWLQSLYLDMA